MKKLNTYKNTALTLAAFAIGMTLMGCAEDAGLSTETAQQLAVTPLVESNQLSRAATASDASLNEDKLSQLNVKIYGEYDECKVDKTFTSGVASKKKETIGKGNWKVDNDLQENKTYTVKAVANYTGTDGTLTDADIWKPYDATNNSNKTFLMSSTQNYTVTQEPTQNIDLNLSRAAAKILVTLHVNIDGYTVGQPLWQLMNYNAKTTVFGDNTESEIKESDKAEATKNSDGTYTITTYSYATSWSDDDKAPAIYLTLPLTATGSTKAENNYFKIPVRDPKATGTDAKTLARNTLYSIDATINSKGGSSEVEYIDAGKVVYDVLAWSDGGTTNIDANTSYLMVYPQTLIMKNIATDNTSISYKSSDELEVTIKEVYYYNKNGKKITITNGYTEKDDSGNDVQLYPKVSLSTGETGKYEGKISIESAIPINLTAKYIVFTVKTKDGTKSVDVVVKQYPIKYVQNIAGWYSTKDLTNWVDWQTDQTEHKAIGYYSYYSYYSYYGKWYYGKTSSDSWFQAKVYGTFDNKTGIWNYDDTYKGRGNNGETPWKVEPSNRTTTQANNHMYVIQITKSDGTYKIAKPKFNSDLSSDDHCVSPAFMLASQLGTTRPTDTFADAAKHCNAYVEVTTDRKYDDWRLPTQEEINSIVEFQNDNKAKQTMDRVLAGEYYWTANQVKSNSVPGSDKDSNVYIRCIRDLSTEEVQELENKK